MKPEQKLQAFLDKENLALQVKMTPTVEETKSGKMILSVTPAINVVETKQEK